MNPNSGSVSQTPAKRVKSKLNGEYEKVRIGEITKRAELYELRIAKLKGNLFDRSEVEMEFAAIMLAIK